MNPLNDQLALAPLGAGDLIDGAVRMYRRHFFTLIRIAAQPLPVDTPVALSDVVEKIQILGLIDTETH